MVGAGIIGFRKAKSIFDAIREHYTGILDDH
jgi:hypothetical protein